MIHAVRTNEDGCAIFRQNLRLCEETKTIYCKTLVQNDKTKVTSKTASNELKPQMAVQAFPPLMLKYIRKL